MFHSKTKVLKPFCLQIESTNACNLDCVMCPRQAMTRPIGFMKLALFKKIIDETVSVDHIWLHHFGEPLLHPKLADMIKYAKDAGVPRVGISTNAVVLTVERGRELIDAGLDNIIISVDGTGRAYERIRCGAKWNHITENIRNFLEEKTVGKPETWIQIINMPSVDIQKTVKFWQKFQYIDKIDVKNFDTWGHQVQAINLIRSKQKIHRRQSCPHLWAVMVICWDGTCVPCCRDFDAKIPLGNAEKQNMINIFNGAEYASFRLSHKRGDFDNPLCRNCVEWAEASGIKTKFKP